ncbi:MAG: carboxypeptidase regulatory-like domain-containing protein [Gemmatimonadaceae bacterium]
MSRWVVRAAVLLAIPAGAATVSAQGVTTGAISGTVTTQAGLLIEGAQVTVTNPATGFSATVTTSSAGRYHVAGLESATSYRVAARRLGFRPLVKNDVAVTLSEVRRLDFVLEQQAATLDEITVSAALEEVIDPSHQGAETTVSDSALRRLPTLNRNFTDFVALTPQVSTTLFNGGLSGGGTNNRYNNVQIDGTSEADVFGLGSTGQPGGQANGKSIGLEAVKEYKVMLSPYDVRQGFFAGLLINAVTKSGTNEFSGTAFGVMRNQNYTRNQPYIDDYEQTQFGFSVGGPIVRDRAFFFISPEFQSRTEPAFGGFLGQSNIALTQARADSYISALNQYSGLNTAGDFGLFNRENPLQNIFARVDVNLPYNSQLVVRYNYGHSEQDVFSRSSSSFKLSDNAYFFNSKKNAPALQLRTLFDNGAYNEFLAGYTQIRDRRTPRVRSPEITVQTDASSVVLVSGSERFSHGNELDQDIFEITENYTMPFGAHRITIGTQNQFQKFRNLFAQSTLGVWRFSSIDSVTNGLPNQYIIGVPLEPDGVGGVQAGGDGAVRFSGAMYSAYIQDEWTVTPRLNVSAGLRLDRPTFGDKPPENVAFQTAYSRSTSDIASGNVQWSPRLGFNWDATGDAVNQVRGGIGLFTGRPAYVWLSNAFQNSGMGGVALLTCGSAATVQPFNNTTIATPPTQCANGTTAALGSQIDLMSPDLKYPQNMRATLGYDRRLLQNWIGTAELLYTRGVNGLFYQNLALAGIQGTNAVEGRTIYGTSPGNPVFLAGGREQIYEVSNQSNDNAYSLTGGIQRRYVHNYEGSLFYTYTRANDVQSFTSSTAFSQLRFGRATGGDLLDKTATRSTFEQRHRIVGQATYTFPTKTDVSLIYFGESGSPYTYIASGDLNGDDFTLNDPVYVPNNAADPSEMFFNSLTVGTAPNQIVYTPAEQAAAFESYINGEKCLSENRGRILPRNACTAPFVNTLNLSARQSFQTLRLQNITFQLDVFNFLNLVNKDWGLQRTPGTSPITLVSASAYTNGTILTGQPAYTFNPTFTRYFSNNLQSNYQIQLQARYGF